MDDAVGDCQDLYLHAPTRSGIIGHGDEGTGVSLRRLKRRSASLATTGPWHPFRETGSNGR